MAFTSAVDLDLLLREQCRRDRPQSKLSTFPTRNRDEHEYPNVPSEVICYSLSRCGVCFVLAKALLLCGEVVNVEQYTILDQWKASIILPTITTRTLATICGSIRTIQETNVATYATPVMLATNSRGLTKLLQQNDLHSVLQGLHWIVPRTHEDGGCNTPDVATPAIRSLDPISLVQSSSSSCGVSLIRLPLSVPRYQDVRGHVYDKEPGNHWNRRRDAELCDIA
jgi:hypothetical protein